MENCKILVVEDEAIVRMDIETRLKSMDYVVIGHASSGQEAIQKANRLKPNLILMDIKIQGDIDGIHTARQIKEQLDVPIIFVTAHADGETIKRAKVAASFGYILKPINSRELNAVIEMVLYKHKAEIERKENETALRESEEKFRAMVENLPIGVFFYDFAGNILYGNKKAEKITGYNREELMGKNIRDTNLLNLHYLQKAMEMLALNKKGKTTGPTEFVLQRKDSQERVVEVNTEIITVGGKKATFGMIVDITRRKQMEEDGEQMKTQLIRAQLTKATANLAGGIAHNFNNALVGISGNAGLLEKKFKDNETIVKHIKPIKSSVQRMAHLTSQLLAYARGGKYQPKIISLAHFIESTLDLAKHSIGSNIKIDTEFLGDPLNIEADVAQMQMVILALLNNATEACNGAGQVRIIVKEAVFRETFTEENKGNEDFFISVD